jgi:hypothetical protein
VVKAGNAAEALECARDFHPDAVLTEPGLTPILGTTDNDPRERPVCGFGTCAARLEPVSRGRGHATASGRAD